MVSEIKIKKYEDIVADIVQHLIDKNEEISDMNVGSVIRSLVEAYAIELSNESKEGLYNQIQKVYESSRISSAVGDDLDEIGLIVGTQRKSGTKSAVELTLKRNTPTSSDITIPIGSEFSTQNVDGKYYKFETSNQYIFKGSISDEEHMFKSGIYQYKLSERFYDNVSSIAGTRSGNSYTFVKDTDWKEVKDFEGILIKQSTINEIIVATDADSTTGWIKSDDATDIDLDNTNYRQGTASFKLGKSGTGSNIFYYEYTDSNNSFDLSGKYINYKFRIADEATKNDLSNIKLRVGNDSLNYYEFNVIANTLDLGWNEIFLNPNDAIITGTPLLTNLNYCQLRIETVSNTVTISNNNLNFDYLIFSEVRKYKGDIIEWIQSGDEPDDTTIFKSNYVPLSKEVEVIADKIGTLYNVSEGKIITKITNLPDITTVYNYEVGKGGEDIETDDDLRNRIKNSTLAPGKATVSTIKNAVESLDFINSANVDDMPLKTAVPETITYTSGTDLYKLNFEVAQMNNYLKVTSVSNSLSADIDDVQTTISLNDTTGFSSSGYVIIDSEVIQYGNVNGNDLENCTRGFNNTTAINHSSGGNVLQWYLLNTDYVITPLNEVSWIGSNKPIDTENFTVNYQYKWLGHFDVFVIGPASFTQTQQTGINNKIIDYKAAGILYNWSAPISILVNISANINIKDGYDFNNVKDNVEQSLKEHMNKYNIGEDVYLSQLIDVIMSVEGVHHTSIIEPTNDKVIENNEIAKLGSLIINQY